MIRFTFLALFVICSSANAWLYYDTFINECKKYGAYKMAAIIEAAHAEKPMEKLGAVTFFAVRDDFFPRHLFYQIINNSTLREEVLRYHIVNGTYRSEDLKNDMVLKTFDKGLNVRTNIYKHKDWRWPTVTVNGAKVISFDHSVKHRKGMVHITDRLLYPIPTMTIMDEVTSDSQFSTLLYAVMKAGVLQDLQAGTLTFFAPTNEAFQNLPPGEYNSIINNQTKLVDVLTYHIVEGTVYRAGIMDGEKQRALDDKDLSFTIERDQITIDGNAHVTTADFPVTNGVIHVIDSVLVPPE